MVDEFAETTQNVDAPLSTANGNEGNAPENTSGTVSSAENAPNKPQKQDKRKKDKQEKPSSADRKAEREKRAEDAKLKKEWEDSIVATKRVKREEMRRKFRQAMIIILVFALTVTSVVYVMLLFVQENNVRITASSENEDKSISLSIDNDFWTPYIDANGPENIWNVSYNPIYKKEKVDTVDDVKAWLGAESVKVGSFNGQNYIRFVFMVKNTGQQPAELSYEMTLDNDQRGLQNAVRVMWGETFKNAELSDENAVSVDVYASKSDNPRLADTNINASSTQETGYIEYVAYPVGSDKSDYSLVEYESSLDTADKTTAARNAGYIATTPFESDEFVFQRKQILAKGDIMYCYCCIWLEGSDFDCVDDAIGGYVKLGVNFIAR